MGIVLQGGPRDGERPVVEEHCRRHRQDGSVYDASPEVDAEGHTIFKYNEQASLRGKPS